VSVVQVFRNGNPRSIGFSEAGCSRLIVLVRLLPLATTRNGCPSCVGSRSTGAMDRSVNQIQGRSPQRLHRTVDGIS
jgi:hypothetical protein